MNIEVLIYCYGAVCLSMIAFNCICIFAFRHREQKTWQKSRRLEEAIKQQIVLVEAGKPIAHKHIVYLEKSLSRVGNLLAFDAALEALKNKRPEVAEQYLQAVNEVFFYLMLQYRHKETMQAAYFLYFLAKYKLCRYIHSQAMWDILKEYLRENSLYCRQNAMKALYGSQDERKVAEGVKILEETGFFHPKILTDGLLTFNGDHGKLIALLWDMLDGLKIETQIAVLNYIRFKSGAYCQEMLTILADEKQNEELRFAAIRYFGKYCYPPAYRVLLQMVQNRDALHWEYAAFGALALANYPGEETVEALKQALYSANWYVRANASQSLEMLGVTYNDLVDVINGGDRYAREIMSYRLDCREIDRKEGLTTA